MGVRVLLSSARKPDDRKIAEAIIGGVERWMLAGENQHDRNCAAVESGGDGLQLDGFGTGADNQNYATGQPSP